MLARRRIRSQLYIAIAMIAVIVGGLTAASLHGSWKFRKLTKSIRGRATELPLTATLAHRVSDLRFSAFQFSPVDCGDYQTTISNSTLSPFSFARRLTLVRNALEDYRHQIKLIGESNTLLRDNSKELECISKIDKRLTRIDSIVRENDWIFTNSAAFDELLNELGNLQADTVELPVYMKDRMDQFAQDARLDYNGWIFISIALLIFATSLTFWLYRRFNIRIFKPLDELVQGSRIVAGGNFDHRIKLQTNDEMAELSEALNAMTANFQSINKDLNNQVQQRTKEVVRSEKMASVGFLAAGVAHEINNPLATIAWSAESLESRIYDILDPSSEMNDGERETEIEEMKKYLRRIQDEAFRCKGITSGLLDFSRMGDVTKVPTNLNELVESVIEMVSPLSRYRTKNIQFRPDPTIYGLVNEQEIKQVALNLITNALDSVGEGGIVQIDLERNGNDAILRVTDDGCGMTPDVMKQLFEPFFTRRRDGQGTGLGLSITYQIIEDHGGSIVPHSDGAGHGATFTVRLPLVTNEKVRIAKAA